MKIITKKSTIKTGPTHDLDIDKFNDIITIMNVDKKNIRLALDVFKGITHE